MNPFDIIDKYYPQENELRRILVVHSQKVADKALQIAARHPELGLDEEFLYEASMLHDIGIFKTHAPAIQCMGDAPYICHGYLGAELMRAEGFPRHAAVCEHHTGAGISPQDIVRQHLPVPLRDMRPITPEEIVVCLADKFFSKTRLEHEKTVEQARRSLEKFGEEGLLRFDRWCALYL